MQDTVVVFSLVHWASLMALVINYWQESPSDFEHALPIFANLTLHFHHLCDFAARCEAL